MAHLEVEPKKSSPWIWILLALVALAVLFFLFKGCGGSKEVATTDSTSTGNAIADTAAKAAAATAPDWNGVDFNSPRSTDSDIADTSIYVSGNDKYTIYSLGSNILFETDKNTLTGSADAKLKTIVESLNKRFKGGTVGVYGSTDSKGDADHNAQLGADRANAVKDWLTKNGLDADKVSVQSLGETEPVASNSTAGGRQQNRNVAIVAFPASN
ncbi:OmpA family protein [Mucilaginibacter sp. ZT4R22]|uniref:OmpA family protein n=1 Tax=Mucilaginibacter pankratovii TaxID=2772110 RepID=A0ABR7WSE2_9SPHI|nr:OmpA family protein [Mucilaginibacter pankratovii]MBD1365103.1 OmpA family protein [Mucilaginibacter pankratovii]